MMNADSCVSASSMTLTVLKANIYSKVIQTEKQTYNGRCSRCDARKLYRAFHNVLQDYKNLL